MCGIAGVVEDRPDDRTLEAMSARIAHRGPDGANISRPHPRVGFAHRRLAIIDLTEGGSQPMRSPSGSEIIYNGEIYNYLELRTELAAVGHRFTTESDTEVLLAAYDQWGEDALARLNGMFAFAICDARRGILFAARDRFGEKPFYYHHAADGTFVFASEIKALLVHPKVPSRSDNTSIYDFLRYKEVDRDPRTMFEGIQALPAAHALTARIDNGALNVRRYWSLDERETDPRPEAELVAEYRERLGRSISLRLRSDVPLGSSLSGGLDSSAVVGWIAKGIGAEQQHAFSARFPGSPLDEGRYIADVVRHANVNLHEVAPTPTFEDLERTVWHQDLPFLSLSIYAQWSVMRLACESGVIVLLDGQGADETMAGYHQFFAAFYRRLFRQGQWLQLAREARGYARANGLRRLRGLGYYAIPEGVTRRAKRFRRPPALSAAFSAEHAHLQLSAAHLHRDDLNQALHATLTQSMLPALLRYADRNSMAFSREVRLPYLDHTLVEFVFSLPAALKLRHATTKRVLRLAMADVLPDSVRGRLDKIGYAPPEGEWLRGPLREPLTDLFGSGAFADRPWTDAAWTGAAWRRLLGGDERDRADLWRLASVELWARRYLDAHPGPSR